MTLDHQKKNTTSHIHERNFLLAFVKIKFTFIIRTLFNDRTIV
jgi:hypothetical protein